MNAKFSPKTGGVYPLNIYKTFPVDAIDIPDDVYKQFKNGDFDTLDVNNGVVIGIKNEVIVSALDIYNAIDNHILVCIKTKDYDSLSEVALAAVDTVFKDEAMKINDWVHECWDVQQQIKDEKIMFETLEAAIKSLPPFDI